MYELDNEVELTLNLMQTDIEIGTYNELQSHLSILLEIKRNVLQQRLVERSESELAKPLSTEEILCRMQNEN